MTFAFSRAQGAQRCAAHPKAKTPPDGKPFLDSLAEAFRTPPARASPHSRPTTAELGALRGHAGPAPGALTQRGASCRRRCRRPSAARGSRRSTAMPLAGAAALGPRGGREGRREAALPDFSTSSRTSFFSGSPECPKPRHSRMVRSFLKLRATGSTSCVAKKPVSYHTTASNTLARTKSTRKYSSKKHSFSHIFPGGRAG